MRFVEDKIAGLVVDPALKPAWRLSKFGLTMKDLRVLYERDPDMDSAAELLSSPYFQPKSREEAIAEMELIDTCAIFA